MANLESYVVWVLLAAVILGSIAWIWLLVQAFQTSALWGILVLLFPLGSALALYSLIVPFVWSTVLAFAACVLSLIFVPTHWKVSRGPAGLFLLACVVAAAGLVLGQFSVSQDPRVTIEEVDGKKEKHITLTRAKGDEPIAFEKLLKANADVVVLQMANEDVNDETLKLLEGLTELRELDLNDTRVTDEGLAILATLPKLEILRLNRTAITDEGFTQHLADKPTLRELHLRGTKVATETLRAWKKANESLDRKFTSGK